MKRIITFVCIIGAVLVALVFVEKKLKIDFNKTNLKPVPTETATININNTNMKITSSAFQDGGMIPGKFTCSGEGINPDLEISGVPQKARSLVLILDDPDAPMGNFNHWVVWNINPATDKINENGVLSGAVVGINDGEKNNYVGPCPPSGTHRYYFKLYALDATLDLSPESRKADVEKAMEGHILEETELLGKYSR